MRAVCGRLIALTLVLGLLVLGAAAARAGSYEDALAGFTTDSFSDTAEAVEAVATTGSPLAAPLLEALRESRLVFSAKDKKVFIKTRRRRVARCGHHEPGLRRALPTTSKR